MVDGWMGMGCPVTRVWAGTILNTSGLNLIDDDDDDDRWLYLYPPTQTADKRRRRKRKRSRRRKEHIQVLVSRAGRQISIQDLSLSP